MSKVKTEEKTKSGVLHPGGGGIPGTRVPPKREDACAACPTACGVCDTKGHCPDHCVTPEDVREWN